MKAEQIRGIAILIDELIQARTGPDQSQEEKKKVAESVICSVWEAVTGQSLTKEAARELMNKYLNKYFHRSGLSLN